MPSDDPTQIVWLKRDLRLDDHAPLHAALERGPTALLYVYEPLVYEAEEHHPSHLEFINQSVRELRAEVRRRGGALLLRRGDIVDVLTGLRRATGFAGLWSHQETGLEATFARDRRVRAWCDAEGVEWTELPQFGVVRPLGSRNGWSRRWSKRFADAPLPAPGRLRALPGECSTIAEGRIAGPRALGLPHSDMDLAQPGGASRAHRLLRSFLDERGMDYRTAMSTPNKGADACSRLSAHIAYGTISLRTIHHAANGRAAELAGDRSEAAAAWRASVASFRKRLRWHCHFIQKLEDEPDLEFRAFNRAYDGLRTESQHEWTDDDWRRFEAWRTGTTGYPMIDACMRSLVRTGWINFRMRAMLASFASYHLWLHWKPTAALLARRFLDFEPGIHYPQFQMQSGVTGINTVRIYSPIKQARDQDPCGVFIRRWVPELAEVPDEFLAEPWKMPAFTQHLARCSIGDDYPEPVVDHRTAYRTAQDRIFALRKTSAHKDEATRVYLKHGSRRRPASRR